MAVSQTSNNNGPTQTEEDYGYEEYGEEDEEEGGDESGKALQAGKKSK
jgi:hypothetical protein